MIILKRHQKRNILDKPWKSFLLLCFLLLFILVLTFITLALIYFNPTSYICNMIQLIILAVTAFLIIFLFLMFVTLIFVYRTNSINPYLLFSTQVGFYYLFPVLIAFSKYFNGHRNSLLLFYIKLNNILVKSSKKKWPPDRTLVLLPHCLQNSDCPHKVTGFVSNCKKCLKCHIGHILLLTEKYHIQSPEIVTGGTAARSAVFRNKPKLIIAIACERDLASGIIETKGIPVIGILNTRPNGPCINTRINIEEYAETLENYIEHSL